MANRLKGGDFQRCSRCGGKAVVSVRYTGEFLCKKCFSLWVEKRVKNRVKKLNLIKPGDKVAVAVSGGKDSTLALYFTVKFAKEVGGVEVFALTVDEGIKGYRDRAIKVLRENVERLEVEHVVVSFKEEYGYTLDQLANVKVKGVRSPCTFCGVFRRRLLNKVAREAGANKLATGHNLDDEVQTFLMDMLRGDIFSLAKMVSHPQHPRPGMVPRIKPLAEIPERENALYALLNGIPFYIGECPYATPSLRWLIREKLNEIEETMPGFKVGLAGEIQRVIPAIADEALKGFSINFCRTCGEPTSGEICKACELLKRVNAILHSTT